jgi:hypothetical protein
VYGWYDKILLDCVTLGNIKREEMIAKIIMKDINKY